MDRKKIRSVTRNWNESRTIPTKIFIDGGKPSKNKKVARVYTVNGHSFGETCNSGYRNIITRAELQWKSSINTYTHTTSWQCWQPLCCFKTDIWVVILNIYIQGDAISACILSYSRANSTKKTRGHSTWFSLFFAFPFARAKT